MVCVVVIVVLSIFDAYISGYMIGAGLAVELNRFYPEWFLTSVWARGIFAFMAALWFQSRGWGWLLWSWTIILSSIAIWNMTQYFIATLII